MNAGAATCDVEIVGIENAPATLVARVSSNRRITILASRFSSRAVIAASRLVRSSLVVTMTALAWRTPACSRTDAMPGVSLDHRHALVEQLAQERRAAGHLDRHDALAQLEQLLDDLIADLADPDHDEMVAAERGEHAIPLRQVLLAREDQEGEPDHRVGDRAQADDRQQEEERLKIPLRRGSRATTRGRSSGRPRGRHGQTAAARGRKTGGGSDRRPEHQAS